MAVVKVIEVISEGASVDAAIKAAVAEVAKTIDHIKQVNVEHIEALVEKNHVVKFRVISKVSFLIHHGEHDYAEKQKKKTTKTRK